jgi:essential nuclear protein 1
MKFLNQDDQGTRSLADIILQKLQEKANVDVCSVAVDDEERPQIPQKVVDVFVSVGKLLQHYKSGKLPKALKMLPHLKNWEYVLWLTRPDLWSPAGTFAVTRIFASNLNVNMAQRFLNMVLLEKCREDIRSNDKLNYHLYLALKKALFKPGAFYKGILLPLAQSGTCTLREATIFGSVVAKVSVPGIHSAAALLRLVEMPYFGSTSMFIKVLLQKKYALPKRVVDGVVDHFISFIDDSRSLPVVWQQTLLTLVQRYKNDLSADQRQHLLALIKIHPHYEITQEIRRELLAARAIV